MKIHKLLSAALAVCLALALGSTAAPAKAGSAAGNVYSTDIRAFINGVEVPSYNIGGKTAIVVEDVLPHTYNNALRTLLLGSFDPAGLQGGENKRDGQIGRVVGHIYATDIKTYVYTTALQAYNLGGKTAVAIEDLGGDREFNDIGGRYFWDGEARTISLEFLYDRPARLPEGVLYAVNLKSYDGTVTLNRNVFNHGTVTASYVWLDPLTERVSPLVMDGKSLGWYVHKPCYVFVRDEDGVKLATDVVDFAYIDPDILGVAAEKLSVSPPPPAEVVRYYETEKQARTLLHAETDNWNFFYMSGATPRGTTEYLLYITSDGYYHDYSLDFAPTDYWGNITFTNVRVDREGEKAYLSCHYKDYVIDLRTGEMTQR
ncbi:MAG: hypothetical protein E7425_02120 [Ruminococcaceae bacterium]|nr:hypothetical protein [Oscillospiraceae bacterium]